MKGMETSFVELFRYAPSFIEERLSAWVCLKEFGCPIQTLKIDDP